MPLQYGVGADGGLLATVHLSKRLRKVAQERPVMRQFCRPIEGYGRNQGQSIDFDKVGNVLVAGGQGGENDNIVATKVLITQDRLTVATYRNAIEYTGTLEDLAEVKGPRPIALDALEDDMVKTIDSTIATELKTTYLAYIPTGPAAGTWDTDGTISTTATANVSMYHLRQIVLAMKDTYLIPPYPDGFYRAAVTPRFLDGIRWDPSFIEIAKYDARLRDQWLKAEVGMAEGVRFVETTHTSALTSVGTGSVLGEGLIMGNDPIVEGIARPETFRYDEENYQERKGIAWIFRGGWRLTWKATVARGQVKVVRIGSA